MAKSGFTLRYLDISHFTFICMDWLPFIVRDFLVSVIYVEDQEHCDICMCSFIVGFCCLVIWQFLIAARLYYDLNVVDYIWVVDIAHSSWAYEYTNCRTVALIGPQISENWPRTIRATVPQLMNTPDVLVFRLHA